MPSAAQLLLLCGAMLLGIDAGDQNGAVSNSQKASLKSGQVQNITITHEQLGTRWDDAGGDAIDRAIASDDGPSQLKDAMLVLMTVAGSVIFGGAAAVACCWQNRERGWLKSSKYQQVEGESNPYKGQGAKWLETPV